MTSALLKQLSGTTSKVDLSPDATAKFFAKYVATPAMDTFSKKIAPRITQQFANVGAFSSRQGDAVASSLTDLNNSLMTQLGDWQFKNMQAQAGYDFQGQENAANRQAQAISLAQQVQNSPLTSAALLTNVLQPLQGHQQSVLDAAYNEFQRMAPENSPWLRLGMDYLGRNSSVTYNPQRNGGIGAAIGGAAGLGMALPALGGAFNSSMGALSGALGGAAMPAIGSGMMGALGPIGLGLGALLGFGGLLG